jgi:site-specific DNA recombinase
MITAGKNKYGYVVYCRKSSEDKDRQVLSIPAQTDWAKDMAARAGSKVNEVFYEERSAKMPYNRPVFDEMIGKIRKGEIGGVICWKLDRLARNPEEAGIVLGLLKRGQIKHVITSDREYRPEDNAIISYVDFGMADQYVRDLSKNVKRGLKAKVAQGWRPSGAPLGYLNDITKPQGERDLIADPARFDLVRRIFDTFLSGDYSVRQLRQETIRWGLRTRQTKRQGGKYLQLSHIYRILTQPFYYGYFWTMNSTTSERELVKGAHKPMITEEEFDIIQVKLGHKGKPRTRKHNLLYTGKIACGECGSMVTGEEKYQLICPKCKLKFLYLNKRACPKCATKIEEMEKPTLLHYIYYHCTKKKKMDCTQKSIRSEKLELQIDQALEGFNLSQEFMDWALEELAQENDQTIRSQNSAIDAQQQRYKDVVAELQNLTRLYTSSANSAGTLLSLDEYEAQRNQLLADKIQLQETQQDTGRKIEEWINWAENDFATAARVWFEKGTPERKKPIFASLSGSNLTLQDGKVRISVKKPLDFYTIIATRFPATKNPLEPRKSPSVSREYLSFGADIPALREILHDVRTFFQTVKRYEWFPIFDDADSPKQRSLSARPNHTGTATSLHTADPAARQPEQPNLLLS